MDPVRNPFAPGAGTRPPELAGRDAVIGAASVAIQRALHGRPARSQIMLGLRGVGKTVLLNRIEEVAEAEGHITSFVEAREGVALAEMLVPGLITTIRRLSAIQSALELGHRAMRALRSFVGVFRPRIEVKQGDMSVAASISVDPEPGVADSGMLDADLTDLFLRLGAAAKAAGKGWTLLIDEMQYLTEADLSALILALHRANQRGLPILFFGAGLPQVAALSGDAKSYAERLFEYPAIGALDPQSARDAIRQPIEDEGEAIEPDALDAILHDTLAYPYLLQEWGYQVWNHATASPIRAADVAIARVEALRRLDEGFFKVRFDRLTPKEREYVIAMARLGAGPYRSADVADLLGETPQALGPRRAKIIAKGMIYSPGHGDIAFTVPLFEDYLARHFL